MNTKQLLVLLISIWWAVPGQAQSSLSEKIEAMARINAAYGPTLNPNGSTIAFLSTESGLPQIWTVDIEGNGTTQITSFSDPISNVSWSPTDANLLAYQLAPGGGMNAQVFLLNIATGQSSQITAGGKSTNWLGKWKPDGFGFTFASNQENPNGMDNYFYTIDNGSVKKLASNKGIGRIIDVNATGDKFLLNRVVSRGSNDIFLLENNEEVLLTSHKGPGSFFGKFGTGDKIYMGSNLHRDKVAFGQIAYGTIKIMNERADAELVDFIIRNDGIEVYLVWNVAGKNEITRFDLQLRREVGKLNLPVTIVSDGQFSKDDGYFIFTGGSASQPTNIWKYDTKNETYHKLTNSSHEGVALDELVEPELVTFESFDGLQLSGWLYKPKGKSAPYPTVISYHGGPEGQARPSFSYATQALLSQGYAVLAPNVRGSGGFGKNFVNLDNGPLRVNGIRDIEACTQFVIDNNIAPKDKIAVMGGSYGGYMVMAGVSEYPNMFAAAANLFGVVNFKTFFEQTEPWMAAISKVEYGDPDTQSAMLDRLSPINKVDAVITPTIVLHGANDTNVPVVEAEQVVKNLEKRNVPVKYVLFDDEGHGWRKTENKVTSTVEIINWFNQYMMK